MLQINCLLRDEPHEHVFPIRIDSSYLVGDLKNLIKAEVLPKADFGARKLILWRVSIPHVDQDLETRLKEIWLDGNDSNIQRLPSTQRLSAVFSGKHQLVDGNIHVLIQQPSYGQCLRSSLNDNRPIF